MTNSMNNVEYVKTLVETNFSVVATDVVDQYQISFDVVPSDVHRVLSLLKSEGWIQLSYLSAVDWIDDNEMQLVYIVFNWEKPVHIQVRTRLDRDKPSMQSILPIYPGCKYYERECHEFFGVKFPGNPDYDKQLILEQWDDMPPMRKDFDPQAYSARKFPVRKYTNDFEQLEGQPSKQVKREARTERIIKIGKGGKK